MFYQFNDGTIVNTDHIAIVRKPNVANDVVLWDRGGTKHLIFKVFVKEWEAFERALTGKPEPKARLYSFPAEPATIQKGKHSPEREQIVTELDELEVSFDRRLGVEKLKELLEEAKAQETVPA